MCIRDRLSTAEAVLRYAEDFLPSWAGAISIDLLPGVLILILSAVQASIRREDGHDLDENHVTIAELSRALKLYETLPPAVSAKIAEVAAQSNVEPEKAPEPSPAKPVAPMKPRVVETKTRDGSDS